MNGQNCRVGFGMMSTGCGETAAVLGQGSFRFAQPPLTNRRYLLYPDRISPAELVRLEDEAHQGSLAWLMKAFTAAGVWQLFQVNQ
jgi:hypothetical protein